MLFRRTLVVALLCALPVLSSSAADDAAKPAQSVKWVLPWKDGTSLTYAASESTTDETKGVRKRSRSSSTTVVRITESSADGFVQTWTGSGYTFEVLEGDKSEEAQMKALAAALDDLPVSVQLNADGNFTGVRNMDVLMPRFRAAMRPIFDGMIEAGVKKIADEKTRATKRAEAQAAMDKAMETMLSPAMMEALLARNISWYNGFVGIDLEPEQAYELETDLPSPLGGPNIPAKLTFSLSVSEDDAEDLFVSYHQAVDSEKARAALRANANHIVDGKIPESELAKIEMTVKDEGFFVVHRPTGLVEMFEATRTTTVNGKDKVERSRMRLLNGDHDHTWKDEETDALPAAAKDA
ncbi:hypothetical protein LF41_1782 [Lysobacter dokdonensis DS-58]|uniref:Uncharacterized protein n=1 Tax=Lysobacter dokdonensis DS-58 TaxID=1300345 RepID=A0A0A2WDX0_9GAMM|nr:hypothetical protein [Lysobacter dokdonensis]KGQ17928.1 hypothetical protein LF41_1782 [Lysobacter dokdonensis DS-58]